MLTWLSASIIYLINETKYCPVDIPFTKKCFFFKKRSRISRVVKACVQFNWVESSQNGSETYNHFNIKLGTLFNYT